MTDSAVIFLKDCFTNVKTYLTIGVCIHVLSQNKT